LVGAERDAALEERLNLYDAAFDLPGSVFELQESFLSARKNLPHPSMPRDALNRYSVTPFSEFLNPLRIEKPRLILQCVSSSGAAASLEAKSSGEANATDSLPTGK
jgi:hypothetical protein